MDTLWSWLVGLGVSLTCWLSINHVRRCCGVHIGSWLAWWSRWRNCMRGKFAFAIPTVDRWRLSCGGDRGALPLIADRAARHGGRPHVIILLIVVIVIPRVEVRLAVVGTGTRNDIVLLRGLPLVVHAWSRLCSSSRCKAHKTRRAWVGGQC